MRGRSGDNTKVVKEIGWEQILLRDGLKKHMIGFLTN